MYLSKKIHYNVMIGTLCNVTIVSNGNSCGGLEFELLTEPR